MTHNNPSQMLAHAIILADEISRLLRDCVNNPMAASEKLSQANNKSNTLLHQCTKIRRALKNVPN